MNISVNKKVLRFFKTDLDKDNKIILDSINRELILNSLSLNNDIIYILYNTINNNLNNKKNFFIFKDIEPLYIHITFI